VSRFQGSYASHMVAVSATAKALYVLLMMGVLLVLAFRRTLARSLVWILLALLTWPFRALRRPAPNDGSAITSSPDDKKR